jgi:hypothetical protein
MKKLLTYLVIGFIPIIIVLVLGFLIWFPLGALTYEAPGSLLYSFGIVVGIIDILLVALFFGWLICGGMVSD